MSPELVLAGIMWVALVGYALTGGADFGGGVWDLLAGRGARAERLRKLVEQAIAPIWEANHVWLILVIVLLFACFPSGFSAITTVLHIPLTAMLIGIVLRGCAFVFRHYGIQSDAASDRWSRTFAISSAVTPLFLGMSLGAVASGRFAFDPETGRPVTDFVSEWAAPFPLAVGGLVLALFSYLAAVYLILEARAQDDDELVDMLRTRALVSGVVVAGFAALGLVTAWQAPGPMFARLVDAPWSIGLQVVIGLTATAALAALWTRRYAAARGLVMAQVTLIVGGFGVGQFPWLIPESITFADAAAPDAVLWAVLGALGAGAVLLVPAFWWLYRVFKASPAAPAATRDGE